MGTIPKLIPGRMNPAAAEGAVGETLGIRFAEAGIYGVEVSASTKFGLKRPFTNRTMESVILYAVFCEDMLRFSVAVVGVRSCFCEILRLTTSSRDTYV